jgi:AraC-like DNA-binding protein
MTQKQANIEGDIHILQHSSRRTRSDAKGDLLKAQELFTTTKKSIAEVAHDAGFGSGCCLSTRFKQMTGLTPLEFRQIYHPEYKALHEQDKFAGPKTALLTTNKTVKQIAAEYGFSSEDYFSHAFKKAEGVWPTEFRKNGGNDKNEKAKILLETTNKSITEIAYEVGYENPDCLTVGFKRVVGMSPTKYRRLHQAEITNNVVSLQPGIAI